MSSMQGKGKIYLMVILLIAREQMQILQPPFFFGLRVVGTTQGLMLSLISPLSNSYTYFTHIFGTFTSNDLADFKIHLPSLEINSLLIFRTILLFSLEPLMNHLYCCSKLFNISTLTH